MKKANTLPIFYEENPNPTYKNQAFIPKLASKLKAKEKAIKSSALTIPITISNCVKEFQTTNIDKKSDNSSRTSTEQDKANSVKDELKMLNKTADHKFS